MRWLGEAIREDQSGRVSAARVTMLSAALTLCLSTVLLTVGSFWQIELVPALTAFGPVLGAMGGAAYVTNRIQTGKVTDDA